MNEDNKNPLIKKTDAIAKFDPQKSKGLILRGFKETEYKVVLVVEDNYQINNLICEEINKNFGYKIKTIPFYDGKPAFDYLRENLNKVDLISSDILLPHLDGIKLLRMCKELCPRIPFIFYTGYDYRDDFAVLAADAYLVYSVDSSGLLHTIGKLLGIESNEIYKLERKGINYLVSDKYEEAKGIFLRLIKLDYKKVYILLGYTYYCLHLYQEAIEAYSQDLKYNLENMASTHYHIGLVYIVLEQKEKALEKYQILKKLDSELAEKLLDVIYE